MDRRQARRMRRKGYIRTAVMWSFVRWMPGSDGRFCPPPPCLYLKAMRPMLRRYEEERARLPEEHRWRLQ